jgi:hypothetical protein
MTLGPVWQVGNGHGGGVLDLPTTRELACDGEIQRLVLGPDSLPLDIGRTTRVIPPALRAAVMTRDGGCAAPGCDRPPAWCEAHHIHHWADGGPTAIDNLIALCNRHHHELHQGKWHITNPPHTRPQAHHHTHQP